MEDNKKKQEASKEEQPITYEQLKAYADQTALRAQKIFQENQALKQALQQERMNNTFREVELVLKCLDHAEMFSPEFINAVTTRLEEVLTPIKEENEEKKED